MTAQFTVQEMETLDRVGDWHNFLKISYKKEMGVISREYPHLRSLTIKYQDIEKWGKTGIALADELIENPGKVIEDIQMAIKTYNLVRTPDNKEIKDLNIRFTGITKKRLLRDLRYEDVNTMVAVEAAVVLKTTEVRPRIIRAVFKCPSEHFTTKIQYSHTKFVEPDGCATDGCNYKKLELLPKHSSYTNQQKVKIQESPEGLVPGQQPQTMDVVILDDACDKLYPGDRATINAIVRSSQRIIRGEKSTVFDLYLELSGIEAEARDFEEVTVDEDAIERIRDIAKSGVALEMITASIAPSIYGYDDIKKGAALQMFGGVTSENADGSINRGNIHIVIIGDPGVAKSKLIKYVSKQSPRGIFVSSVTASGVGLTGMATRDDEGRWTIEAGALPLADNGTAAVDEIDKAETDTIDSLLNIMEDGEVRIVKAGQNRILKARCSLICAGNWKHERFEPFDHGGIADQVDLPPAFLSRFDLIFTMIDNPEPKSDEAKSKHLIKVRYIAECKAAGKLDKVSEEDLKETTPPIPTQLLKQYIAYSKRTTFPVMNPQVREKLTNHYVLLRGGTITKDSPSPITMRQQEALVRLSEASARIRLSNEVTLKDADAAITLFDNCMKAVVTDPKTGKMDFGRIGQGISQSKKNAIGGIKEIIRGEPGLSLPLLYAKMAERGYTNEEDVKVIVDQMISRNEVLCPRFEHYRMV